MTARRLSAAAAVLAASLAGACGGIPTVSRDGYRALAVLGPAERYAIAVRGELRRVEGEIGGSRLVKILRPDLGKVWQFRSSTRKLLEEKWEPSDEIVPGYPLEPHFDQDAYADRFDAQVKQIGDGVQGVHPCDRYALTLPSGDEVFVWAARDLERLPVKLEHMRRKDGELVPVRIVELLDVRAGADRDLFEKPKSYKTAVSYEELSKP
jgi:hypothetical protein